MTKRNPQLKGYQQMEALVQMQKENKVLSLQTWGPVQNIPRPPPPPPPLPSPPPLLLGSIQNKTVVATATKTLNISWFKVTAMLGGGEHLPEMAPSSLLSPPGAPQLGAASTRPKQRQRRVHLAIYFFPFAGPR